MVRQHVYSGYVHIFLFLSRCILIRLISCCGSGPFCFSCLLQHAATCLEHEQKQLEEHGDYGRLRSCIVPCLMNGQHPLRLQHDRNTTELIETARREAGLSITSINPSAMNAILRKVGLIVLDN